jgi:hypothetical protein
MENKFNLPTEMVELPSKGTPYPKDSILATGKIEMKYMTAKEEDILTNTNYIRQGVVVDKLLKSLIISDINYEDLLTGDKNAIMIAARILAYGANYEFMYDTVSQVVDLATIESKPLHEDFLKAKGNEFPFKLPHTDNTVTFKLLTHGDESKIDQEIKGLQKIGTEGTSDVTVRLAHMITSVNGSRERSDIREFVNKYFLSKDAREFRKYYNTISPDLDLKIQITTSDGGQEDIDLPIGISFFWPDSEL